MFNNNLPQDGWVSERTKMLDHIEKIFLNQGLGLNPTGLQLFQDVIAECQESRAGQPNNLPQDRSDSDHNDQRKNDFLNRKRNNIPEFSNFNNNFNQRKNNINNIENKNNSYDELFDESHCGDKRLRKPEKLFSLFT